MSSSLPACLQSSPCLLGRDSRCLGLGGSLARGFWPCFRGLSEQMSHLVAVATPAMYSHLILAASQSGSKWEGWAQHIAKGLPHSPLPRVPGLGKKG